MPDPVVECIDVTKTYDVRRGGHNYPVVALDSVSFSIARGRTLGVVGESGSGKSTLGRIAAALAPPSSGQVLVGGVAVRDMSRAELRPLRRRVQIIWQDALSSMNVLDTIETVVTEAPISHGLFPRSERRSQAIRILGSVGLPADLLGKRPTELSGGQLQRIAIGRALALQPELIICDEVTSALDVSVQAQILNLLHEVQQRTQVAYLFVSHDLHVVRHISDDVAVMHAGRIVEIGPAPALYAAPDHPYSRELLRVSHGRMGEAATEGETPDGRRSAMDECHYRSACPLRQSVCSSVRPRLTGRSTGTASACHVTASPALSISDINR